MVAISSRKVELSFFKLTISCSALINASPPSNCALDNFSLPAVNSSSRRLLSFSKDSNCDFSASSILRTDLLN
jgi:hypothetical protein